MNSRIVLVIVLGILAVPTKAQTASNQTTQPDSPSGFDVSPSTPNVIFAPPAQQKYFDHRPRLIIDGEIGSAGALGFLPLSTEFGPRLEIPMGDSWEMQTVPDYSPDRKAITHDGNSLILRGSVIRFVSGRVGVSGGIARSWLWTSQFNKQSLAPNGGIVFRTEDLGRIYLNYRLPTGCVWATPSNPCRIQSNRLQGVEFRQEARRLSRIRFGFNGGVYHFCDQGNPNEPQAGRRCHFGVTAFVNIGFESHLGKLSRFNGKAANDGDNF